MKTRTRLRAIALGLALAATAGSVLAPQVASAQSEPALPPPPLTVQDVVNELLPLIRQLDPLLAQLTPVINSVSKPLLDAGSASAGDLRELAALLEPLVALGAPAVDAVAGLVAPVVNGVDQQLGPQLDELFGVLGPYLNQVDLATAFQIIGPLAPTAVQAIPTLNKLWDSVDVIAPLRDPLTCPIARAVPSQPILDIVTPFLCYNTIVDGDLPTGGGDTGPAPSPTDEAPAPSPTEDALAPSPTDGGTLASESPAGSIAESVPPPSLSSSPGGTTPSLNSIGTPGIAPPLQPPSPVAAVAVSAEDDRVELLEARMRLMILLLSGLGVMLWSFFRAPDDEGQAGLGSFRRKRTGVPPALT